MKSILLSNPANHNICITFIQRRPNVFDVGPTLYKWYIDVLCWLVKSMYFVFPGAAFHESTQRRTWGSGAWKQSSLPRPQRRHQPPRWHASLEPTTSTKRGRTSWARWCRTCWIGPGKGAGPWNMLNYRVAVLNVRCTCAIADISAEWILH